MREKLDDRELLLRQVPEAAFTRQVIGLAHLNRWLVHHSRAAMMRSGKWATALIGHPGLPDLVMVRAPRLIFAELKSQTGVLTVPQVAWREALLEARVEYYLWRPGDMDQIKALLARVA